MLDFTPDMISIENSSYMIISDKQISQPSLMDKFPKQKKSCKQGLKCDVVMHKT